MATHWSVHKVEIGQSVGREQTLIRNKPNMVLNFFMKVFFAYFAANILIKYVK